MGLGGSEGCSWLPWGPQANSSGAGFPQPETAAILAPAAVSEPLASFPSLSISDASNLSKFQLCVCSCFADILGIPFDISVKGPFAIHLPLGTQSSVFLRLFLSRSSSLFWAMLWAAKLCVTKKFVQLQHTSSELNPRRHVERSIAEHIDLRPDQSVRACKRQ